MSSKHTAGAVLKIAHGEVGYLEKKSNADLYDKTANAGENNYTKYAYELDKTSMYNGRKNGYAWCDMFNDWCHYHLSGFDKAMKVLCQKAKGLGAGCEYSLNYYKAAGRAGSTPKLGAQIFFYNQGDATHTGIVYGYDASKVYTIEGNTSGASGVVANGGGVKRKEYSRGYSRIKGYGYPVYDVAPVTCGTKKAKKVLVVRSDSAKTGKKVGEVALGKKFKVTKLRVNTAGNTWGYTPTFGGWVLLGKADGTRYVQ